MGRKNNNAFIKKQKAERKRKKREEKRQKMEARKNEVTSGNLDDMTAYVDQDGNITSEPPEENKKDLPDKKNVD
ncbi:cold-shock protein [Fulvivirgaceae bacterium BMA10]|uniref:Cold-shock protein n=1 Tax=Splendidivirga corallicola TaxID=3051826 RepID=A0ABT8KQF4_9BACT|nr:cold-shock protein [Fulvivirgaceae bacterium BMA10]